MRPSGRGESGQAMVESALTLPLMVFLILGTLQLFLMLQGRLLAEYAAFRATRVGSVNHGDCQAMTHAAILALMPSYYSFLGGAGGSPGQKLANAFAARRDNQYNGATGRANRVSMPDGNHTGAIVWIIRDSPLATAVPNEDALFDQFDNPAGIVRLETRLVYWFPLKIPFANWVIARLTMARWGWRDYTNQNPLMQTQRARWTQGPPSMGLEGLIREEALRRMNSEQYVIPIHASASLRMLTPVQRRFFQTQNCAPAPEAL
ncbi:TadE/TadG family type IV pilus assembly protein [Myxococcus sp. AB056]|uniref:TadE/TadG family type IV pilus assembly protein n=1 Tax=Myxococcus sp. AB056 TaxID=2562792 RepID=UPI00114638D1|nr:TadE family protein [Myxococcus sp. AB056]